MEVSANFACKSGRYTWEINSEDQWLIDELYEQNHRVGAYNQPLNIFNFGLLKEIWNLIWRKMPNVNNVITTVNLTALCKHVMVETDGLAK